VQNRRAEQAIQLAQSEIDRVRVAVERKTATPNQLPPRVGASLSPKDAPAPSSVIPQTAKMRSPVPACNIDNGQQATVVTEVILVDTDPEPAGQPCKAEFMIQTFRGRGLSIDTATTAPDSFVMGVRVYSIAAEANVRNGRAESKRGTLRGGTGLGTQQIRPLTTQYSTIVRSNQSDGLDIYRELCTAAGEACFAAPP
jgi:hypothetical protein